MATLSVKDCITFGWRTFRTRPWFFVSVSLLVLAISLVSGSLQAAVTYATGRAVGGVVALAISLAVNTFVSMGALALYLRAHDEASRAELRDLWCPEPFWRYLGTLLLLAIGIAAGLILLIVPGIIFALACGLSRFIVIERKVSPIAALKESARITRGNRLSFLLLVLALLGLNILGVLALGIGLFVSIPVTILAVTHAYRTLAQAAG